MAEKKCFKCGGKVRQLRNEETGSKINPKQLVAFFYCAKCNRTYEEAEWLS